MEDISLNTSEGNNSEIDKSITMDVSPLVGKNGNKKAYILFKEENRAAEFAVPEVKLMMNSGFSEEEIDKLFKYVEKEKNKILSIAKNVSPLKAFMGMKQG